MQHWHALYTKPNREHQVETWLQQQGIENYLPTLRRRVRRRDRPDRVVYFPCYLFARLDFEVTPISSVAWMPGIRRIVSNGEQPTVVADEMVALVRRRLEGMEGTGYVGFDAGDRVRIASGPLRDLEAVFDRPLTAAERVRILLNVMGRMVLVDIDPAQLVRI